MINLIRAMISKDKLLEVWLHHYRVAIIVHNFSHRDAESYADKQYERFVPKPAIK